MTEISALTMEIKKRFIDIVYKADIVIFNKER
jgi:hypothetical protein